MDGPADTFAADKSTVIPVGGGVSAMRDRHGTQEWTLAQLYQLLKSAGPTTLDQLFRKVFGEPFDDNATGRTVSNNFLSLVNTAINIGLVVASPPWQRHRPTQDAAEHAAHMAALGGTLLSPSPAAQQLFNGLGFSFAKLAQLKGKPIIVSPEYEIDPYRARSVDVFCIFPFRKPHDAFFEKVVKPAIEGFGFSVQLAVDHRSSKFIAEEIFNSIMAARIVVADCTGANPNVLYEVGLAHAIGKPVVLLTRQDKDIPFDLRHIRYLTLRSFSRGGLPLDKLKQALTEQADPPVTVEPEAYA
jgi:hypothetical protein